MSITSSSLYSEHKVRTDDPGLLKKLDVTNDEVINEYISEALEKKRKPNEIEVLKFKLKEKALLLEKAPTVKRKGKRQKKGRRLIKASRRFKSLGFYDIPKDRQKYEHFLPLHELWKQYFSSSYTVEKTKELVIRADERLLRMDYHGAELTVSNCKCKSYIGLKGIVFKETKNMLMIITINNEVKSVPKKDTVFSFELEGHKVKLNGDAMLGRPGVRMAKKFRPLFRADLLIDTD